MKRQILKYTPTILKEKLKKIFANQYRRKLINKNAEEVFEFIYRKKIWGNNETKSGGGSVRKHTKELEIELPKLLKKYNIKTILDIPCGDFNWMKNLNLDGIRYIGGDIVKDLIEINKERYSEENKSFLKINLIEDSLPESDLLLCRDCFVHLSNKEIQQSLFNIRSNNIKFLLVTSFRNTKKNKDIITGEWRKLNMEIAPFNLKSKDLINEKCTQNAGKFSDKSLILVEL